MDIVFIEKDEVVEINSEELGVQAPENILKPNELESAVMSIRQGMFGEYLYKDVFEMSANLAHHLAMNHSFIDANKRTAYASALRMLELNGYDMDESFDIEYAELLLDIVNHRKEVSDLTEFFREKCVPLGDDYYDDDSELTDEEIQNSLIQF